MRTFAIGALALAFAGAAAAQNDHDHEHPEPPDCPVATAHAGDDGLIHLEWDPVPGAGGYNVYRDGLFLGTLPPDTTEFEETFAPGTALAYQVATQGPAGDESPDCPILRVTAIPEIPAGALLPAVAALAAVTLLAARRR